MNAYCQSLRNDWAGPEEGRTAYWHFRVPDIAQRTLLYPELGCLPGTLFILRYSGRNTSKEGLYVSISIYFHRDSSLLSMPWSHDTLSCILCDQFLLKWRHRAPLLKALVMVSTPTTKFSSLFSSLFSHTPQTLTSYPLCQ